MNTATQTSHSAQPIQVIGSRSVRFESAPERSGHPLVRPALGRKTTPLPRKRLSRKKGCCAPGSTSCVIAKRPDLEDYSDGEDDPLTGSDRPGGFRAKARKRKYSGFMGVICTGIDYFKRLLMMIPVFLVLGLITLDFYALIIKEMPRRFEKEPVFCSFITVTWIPVVFLLVVSYLRTVFTSSAVEDNPPPPHFDTGAVLRCRKCSSLKPVRAHHCSICQKCTLKMDHHCPWVANCVGYNNYKFFCLFLFYADLGCFMFVVGSFGTLRTLFSAGHGSIARAADHADIGVSILFASILTFAFALTLLMFGGFHASLVLKNYTTLEFGDNRPSHGHSHGRDQKCDDDGASNRFDEGSRYQNFVSVFGPNPLLWFLPIQTIEAHRGWGWNQKLARNELL